LHLILLFFSASFVFFSASFEPVVVVIVLVFFPSVLHGVRCLDHARILIRIRVLLCLAVGLLMALILFK